MLLTDAVDYRRSHVQDDDNWQPHQFTASLASQAALYPLFRKRPIELAGGSGRVVLTGQVGSYYEKQLAQEYVRRFDGVTHIDNRLEVHYR